MTPKAISPRAAADARVTARMAVSTYPASITGYDATVRMAGLNTALVHLHSDAARDWVRDHVQDDAQFFGGALVVEPRYLESLLAGMIADGLSIDA